MFAFFVIGESMNQIRVRQLISANCLIVSLLFSATAAAGPITGLVNSGAGVTPGTLDTNYSLSKTGGDNGSGPAIGANPYAGTSVPGGWLANTSASQWLTPAANGSTSYDHGSTGTYYYTLQFDLTGFDHTTASFDGRWATDNSGVLSLNGNVLNNPSGGFNSWSTFQSTSTAFVAGLNTLTFAVDNFAQNGGNPTGLRVEFLNSNVELASVPEPPALVLLLLGILAFARSHKRKLSAS